MGGVVNIMTRKQKAKKSLTATVEGGSYGTLSESAAGGMTAGDFSLRFSGAHFSSDGFSRRGNRDTSEADGMEKTSGTLRLSYAPSDGPSFDGSVTATREVSEYDGTVGNEPYTATRTLVSGFGKMTLPTWNGWLDQSVTAFGKTSDRLNLEPSVGPGAIPVSSFTSTNFGAEYQAIADLAAAGTLTLGARVEQERARNAAQTATLFPGFQSTRTYFAGYAQHELTLLDNLHFTFSGRYDGEVNGDGFLTGRATAAYDWPDHGTRLHASIGTGAKRPTGYQIGNNLFAAVIAPGGIAVPTDLKTEKSIGVDAGIEQTFLAGAVHLSATAFTNRFTNLLGFTAFPFPLASSGYYDNTDRAETSGLEFALDTQIWPDVLSANVTYTWMPTRNLLTGRPLPRRPEHSGSFSVTFSPNRRFETTLTGTVVGPRTNLASSSTMLSGWWRLDLSGSYALTDSTKLFGRIENLTDNRYQDPSGFNTPGFSAYVGLTWNN
jgi:vitamin B12 transporter